MDGKGEPMSQEALNKVVELKASPGAGTKVTAGLRPKALRRRMLVISFLLCVVLPAILGSAYFLFVASDRYVSGAGFAVRSMESGGGADLFGTFTGLADAGSTTSDSHILLKYLRSRTMLEQLERDFPLRQAFSAPGIDFLSRLDPGSEIEHVLDYWEGMISTTYDNMSGILTFSVQAFTPADAERIARLVLEYCTQLVNDLSEKARADAVAFAEGEVQRAEERLRAATENLRNFRESEQSIDPTRSAEMQIQIVGALERQLLDIRARIAALEGTVDADSPALQSLRRQEDALERQIEAKQSEITSGEKVIGASGSALSGQLATYEALEVERNFAQQAYASALSSLEKARVEAGRQQRYLAVYEWPALAEYPLYPRRVLNSLLLTVVLCAVWGIGALIVYAVRDHLS
jgi:Capsule polysaccharide export protein